MNFSRVRNLLCFMVGLVFVSPLAAQSYSALEEPAPVLAPMESPVEASGGALPEVLTQFAAPTRPEDPVAEFRRTVQEFRKQKHQYVHCKLKNGKILTGQIKGAGFEAFDIKTEALGGIHTVTYGELAETPLAVPAVGTRFKQAAEWTGVGVGAIVLLPLFILLSPILFTAGLRC